jgi:hypothetical protein
MIQTLINSSSATAFYGIGDGKGNSSAVPTADSQSSCAISPDPSGLIKLTKTNAFTNVTEGETIMITQGANIGAGWAVIYQKIDDSNVLLSPDTYRPESYIIQFANTANPTAGTSSITIAGKTYNFVSPVGAAEGNVLVGVDLATTMQNLVAAINLWATSGTNYASATLLNFRVQGQLSVGTQRFIVQTRYKQPNLLSTFSASIAGGNSASFLGPIQSSPVPSIADVGFRFTSPLANDKNSGRIMRLNGVIPLSGTSLTTRICAGCAWTGNTQASLVPGMSLFGSAAPFDQALTAGTPIGYGTAFDPGIVADRGGLVFNVVGTSPIIQHLFSPV